MSNIVNFNDLKERYDPEYAVDMVNRAQKEKEQLAFSKETKKVNFIDRHREIHDPEYAIDMVNRHYKIQREESYDFVETAKPIDFNLIIGGAAMVLGEVMCTLSFATTLLLGLPKNYVTLMDAVMGIIILPGAFYIQRKEILEAFKNLCFKFKHHNKTITRQELLIFDDELRDLGTQEFRDYDNLDFPTFDDPKKR